MPPEDACYEDPCVEDGRLHRLRTLRKARLTIAEASAEECEPAAGCASRLATSALASGLTGRMSRPLSPRSNTFGISVGVVPARRVGALVGGGRPKHLCSKQQGPAFKIICERI